MTSQKFQLTAEYKRKEKRFFIFLAFFFPIFTIITGCYSEGEKLTWKFFWIGVIITLVITSIIIFAVYFIVLRKMSKHWVELEFTEDTFIIHEMGKQKEFLYSKIMKVVIYQSKNNELFYTKIVLPNRSQYIMGFEKENEIIQIVEQKADEYRFKIQEKIRYINITNYKVRILLLIFVEILVAIFLHFVNN